MTIAVALAFLLVACGSSSPATAPPQPLPTVEPDGSLAIPEGYAPGPTIDLARVDCKEYLAMTPRDIREEARALCESSATAAEKAQNPYCEVAAVTRHCEAGTAGAR